MKDISLALYFSCSLKAISLYVVFLNKKFNKKFSTEILAFKYNGLD